LLARRLGGRGGGGEFRMVGSSRRGYDAASSIQSGMTASDRAAINPMATPSVVPRESARDSHPDSVGRQPSSA
jgi:hypothetical protein